MTPQSSIALQRTGSIARVTFNSPENLNAVTTRMLDDAADAVTEAAHDPAVRAVLITGAGRAFSSGASLPSDEDEGPDPSTIDAANRLVLAVRDAPKPVIAAVNGPAVGVGCSIALAADLTVARESAYFFLAFAGIGLMPDGGATALLPAAIGRARATRMAMLAERVPAATAAEWGMIARAVPDDQFDHEVERLAERLANGPTAAFAQTKRAFNASTLAGLEHACAIEREGQLALFDTDDFAEGVAAFRGKREPHFSGE